MKLVQRLKALIVEHPLTFKKTLLTVAACLAITGCQSNTSRSNSEFNRIFKSTNSEKLVLRDRFYASKSQSNFNQATRLAEQHCKKFGKQATLTARDGDGGDGSIHFECY